MRSLSLISLLLFMVLVPSSPVSATCCVDSTGDVNLDGSISISDFLGIINFMNCVDVDICLAEADVNGDGAVNGADSAYLYNYMFASGPAPLSCQPYPGCVLSIDQQPKDTSFAVGGTVTLSVGITTTYTPYYAWYKDGVLVGCDPTYQIDSAAFEDGGYYWVTVRTVCDSVKSDSAKVQVVKCDFDPNPLYLCDGDTRPVDVTVLVNPPGGAIIVTLASKNPAVATFAGAIPLIDVTGESAGQTQIEAKYNGDVCGTLDITSATITVGNNLAVLCLNGFPEIVTVQVNPVGTPVSVISNGGAFYGTATLPNGVQLTPIVPVAVGATWIDLHVGDDPAVCNTISVGVISIAFGGSNPLSIGIDDTVTVPVTVAPISEAPFVVVTESPPGIVQIGFDGTNMDVIGVASGSVTIGASYFGKTCTNIDVDVSGCVQIGALEVCADAVTDQGNGVFLCRGNVRINDILYFSGDLTVNVPTFTIAGSGQIEIRDIPNPLGGFDNYILWDGQIEVNVANEVLENFVNPALSQMNLAGLSVEINSITLLGDGIRIGGELVFPPIMEDIKVAINTLTLTASNGLQVAGTVDIDKEINIKAATLKDVSLTFDTQNDRFGGGATMEIKKLVTIGGSAVILQGKLNEITLTVTLATPVPIDATGLSLKGGSGSVQHISDGRPILLTLTVDITGGPTIAGYEIVEFSQMGIEAQPPEYLKVKGKFKVFSQNVASAHAKYQKSRLSAGFRISLANVYNASFKAALARGNVSGKGRGSLAIPNDLPWYLKPFAGRRLGGAEVSFRNSTMKGRVWMNVKVWPFKARKIGAAFKLAYMGGTNIDFFIGTNYSNLIKLFRKSLRAGQVIQAFAIPANTGEVLFMVRGLTNPVAPFKLIGPDSTEYDSTSVPFVRMDSDNMAFYIMDNPKEGIWQIDIPNDGGDTFEFEALSDNTRPALSFTEPLVATTSGQISWIDSDPDDDAQIELFFDTDNEGFDGVLINSVPISEDSPANTYLWDISTESAGEYYVYAVISDTMSVPYSVYAPGRITITNVSAPSPPTGINAVPTDTSIKVGWTPGVDSIQGYTVHYSDDTSSTELDEYATVGDTAGIELFDLIPGRYYRLAVSCFDSLNNVSDLSSTIIALLENTIGNNPPQIDDNNIPLTAQENRLYGFTIDANDVDGDGVAFTADSVPTGFVISTGQVSWTPDSSQLGPHPIRIIGDDGNGGVDTVEYEIQVLDTIASIGEVWLNKPIYFGESDAAIINLDDYDLVQSQSEFDSVQVNLASETDPTGIDIWLKQLTPSSTEFTGNSFYSTTVSNRSMNTLAVSDSDLVTVTYLDADPSQAVVDQAFWFNAVICCTGGRGNVNGDALDNIDISDVTYLVSYMFKGGTAPPCEEEADMNNTGSIDIADLTYIVAYLFTGGPAPLLCP